MKKSKKPSSTLNRFWVALSELNSGQQFILILISLGLLLFVLWVGLAHHFSMHETLDSTASYEGLNPAALGYWRERAERDIESAQSIAGKSSPVHTKILLRRNLSATIRAASQIKNSVEKTNALAAIVNAQIARNVGTNLNEALQTMDRSRECQQIKMSLYASLAFFYIQSESRLEAKSAINDYFQFLRNNPIDPDDAEQCELLNRITDACVILNMDSELNDFLQDLIYTTNTLQSSERKEKYFALIAEQQIRLQKYNDAIATLENIKSPELLAKGFQRLIENRVRLSTPDYEKVLSSFSGISQRSRIRHPEMIAQLLERIYITIGRIPSPQVQSQIFDQLFESEMMVYPELRDLIRGVLLESRSIESSVKLNALAVIDNPKSKMLREAMGMASLESAPNVNSGTSNSSSTSGNGNGEQSGNGPFDRNQHVFSMQTVSQDRIYVEEIRILINTAIEFLNWGNRKDAVPLLNQAVEKSKGLVLEKKQGVSRTAIATLLLGAGEVEQAQSILADAFALLNYLQKTKQIDSEFAQIAEVQIRGRLLEDAFLTVREILPGSPKNQLLQLLVEEWIRIGHWNEALKCVNEMPGNAVKTKQQNMIQNAAARFEKKRNENLYEYPDLNEILRSETAEKSERLFQLFQTQIQENLIFDAYETAQNISDASIRNEALKRIVQESILCARPYFSQLPLHQQVRRDFYDLGMRAAKNIDVPQERLSEMVNVYSQTGWNLPKSSTQSDGNEILDLWNTNSDSGQTLKKVQLANRMVQVWMRRDAVSSVSWVSGPRYFFSPETENESKVESVPKTENTPKTENVPKTENASEVENVPEKQQSSQEDDVPRQERQDFLLKSAQLAQTLTNAEERVECFHELSSLFYLNGDSENGKTFYEQTLSQIEQLKDQKRKAEIYLSLAQTQHLAKHPEEVQKMFLGAVDAANAILSKNSNAKRIDRILEKRLRERVLADICRGKAEIGLLQDAIKTSESIGEQFFVDRLCKTIGYIQMNNGDYKDAELTFKKIENSRFRISCLNDALFRIRWQSFAEQTH